MEPKSVLNDLRRRVVEELLAKRVRVHVVKNPRALEELRGELPAIDNGKSKIENALHVLVRTMEQLDALIGERETVRPATVYADFEDVRRIRRRFGSVGRRGCGGGLRRCGLWKPGEEGFLKQASDCEPDLLLVRDLGAIHYYRDRAGHLPLVGDFALNDGGERADGEDFCGCGLCG